MILTTLEYIPNQNISEHFGLVTGSTVRSKHIGRDIVASIKNTFGGELKGYTQLLEEARAEATERIILQAQKVGANAILGIRYSTSSVASGAAEIYVYGSAVKVG